MGRAAPRPSQDGSLSKSPGTGASLPPAAWGVGEQISLNENRRRLSTNEGPRDRHRALSRKRPGHRNWREQRKWVGGRGAQKPSDKPPAASLLPGVWSGRRLLVPEGPPSILGVTGSATGV